MKDETLDEIELEYEKHEADQGKKENKEMKDQVKKEEAEKYKEALAQGYHAMGAFCGGVEKLWPYVGFGENEKEAQKFFDTGAVKIADVLKKYDVPEPPAWYGKWKEEIACARFFGMAGFSIYMQVSEYKRLEAEAESENNKQPEGEKDNAKKPE